MQSTVDNPELLSQRNVRWQRRGGHRTISEFLFLIVQPFCILFFALFGNIDLLPQNNNFVFLEQKFHIHLSEIPSINPTYCFFFTLLSKHLPCSSWLCRTYHIRFLPIVSCILYTFCFLICVHLPIGLFLYKNNFTEYTTSGRGCKAEKQMLNQRLLRRTLQNKPCI